MPKRLMKELQKLYHAVEKKQLKKKAKLQEEALAKEGMRDGEIKPVSSKEAYAKNMAELVKERDLLEELLRIIREQKITPVFQPIVDLRNGSIMGFESLARGPANSPLHMPATLFSTASRHNMTLPLEQVCREMAIRNMKGLGKKQQLFLNITPGVINDPEFQNGTTKRIALSHGVDPEQITLEITERTAISDYANFSRALLHYRRQGYNIAVDDAGAGYSSLQAIAELYPDHIKLDMAIVRDIHTNPFKRAILEALVNLAAATNSKVIAEGVETKDELLAVMKMGVGYAQGYYLARPAYPPLKVSQEALQVIVGYRKQEAAKKSRDESILLGMVIGDIVEHVPVVEPETRVDHVEEMFAASSVRGVAVVQGRRPVGLLMKNRLYYHLGTYYGVSLYQKRSVELVMDNAPLIVNADLPLEAVSKIAMSRNESVLYDLIMVVKNDQYIGVVSIMNLLNHITQLQVQCAHNSNPLSGLPGNLVIEDRIRRLLGQEGDFAVLYIDLNNFKAYNDKYGFERGDKVLLLTAEILSRSVAREGDGNDFLGHIGGDDFIIITTTERAEAIGQAIIQFFDEEIRSLYSEDDLERGFIQVKNRKGHLEKYPVMSIAVAGVSNQFRPFDNYWEIPEVAAELKKLAKQKGKSSVVFDRRRGI